MSDYLQIKYRNSCDLGGSVFQSPSTNFYYVYYLNVDVGKPTFELVDEGREDMEKNFIPDFRKLQKKFEFTTSVPEYQFDMLCHIQLHDTIFIRLKNEERSRVYNFTVTPNGWNENGNLISITVSFTTDYTISTGCCNNEKIVYEPCYECNTAITTVEIVDVNDTTAWPDRTWVLKGYTDLITGEMSNFTLYYYRYSSGETGVYSRENGKMRGVYVGKATELLCFTFNSVDYHFYYKDGYWHYGQTIRSATLVGATVNVRCWMYPNTFGVLYASSDGVNYVQVGLPIMGGTMENVGITTGALASGVWYFKVRCYNNNCDYGYSNIVTVTVP